jgi:hypothetical protein
MIEREPWSIHQDLTRERLVAVAQLILTGRNDALDRHDPNVGGDPWTLGCSAFQYQRYQITKAVLDRRFAWLSILDSSMQFIFQIGAVPMRFYRGDAEEPTARTLRQAYPELLQASLFPPTSEAREYAHRLAVETDIEGAVTSIKYVAMSGDSAEYFWEIPLVGVITPIRPVGVTPAEGVELPPPAVEVLGENEGDIESEHE